MPLADDRMSQDSVEAQKPRRGLLSRVLLICGLALLVIVPLRIISLVGHVNTLFPGATFSSAPDRSGEHALPTAEQMSPIMPHRPDMTLANGDTAREIISSTLAGGVRAASPVGADDRPADGKLLAEVARRQAELDERQHALETKSAQVQVAETLAKQQIAELTKLRSEIEKLVVHETGAADADIDLLVGLYSNMKPTQAAAVLGKMDPQRAGLILEKLGDRAGGPILAAMDPSAALAISEDIAQRRAAFRH